MWDKEKPYITSGGTIGNLACVDRECSEPISPRHTVRHLCLFLENEEVPASKIVNDSFLKLERLSGVTQ